MAAISPSPRPPTRSPHEYVSLWICQRNQSQEKKSWEQQRRPPPFPPFTRDSAMQKVRLGEAEYAGFVVGGCDWMMQTAAIAYCPSHSANSEPDFNLVWDQT